MDPGPSRTCVGCRKKRPQQALIRVARTAGGEVSIGSGSPGRGAYLCPDPACIEAAFRTGRMHRALRSDAPDEGLKAQLMSELKSMRRGTDG
jgi:uncharacterized protein